MGKDAVYKRKELMRGKLNKNLKKRIIKSDGVSCMGHTDWKHGP